MFLIVFDSIDYKKVTNFIDIKEVNVVQIKEIFGNKRKNLSTLDRTISKALKDYDFDYVLELFKEKIINYAYYSKKENNKVTVLASECDTENALRARFVLFDLIFEGYSCRAVMHDSFNRVQKYEYYHRNAGKITREGLLPLQRSTPAIYGYALMFIDAHDCVEKLHTVGDIAYSESEKELLPSEIKMNGRTVRPIGTHTYAENSGFEIIDIQYLERNPGKNKQRRPTMKSQS